MRPTRIRSLVLVLAAATVLALVLLRLLRASSHPVPPVPWTAAAGLLLVAILVVAAAWPVWRMTRGRPGARAVHPLRAARVAVLGKATAYAGALVLAWYLGQVLLLLPDIDISTRRGQLVRAAVAGAAALLVCVAGVLAERMCRVPPDRDASEGPPGQLGPPAGDTDVTDELGRHG